MARVTDRDAASEARDQIRDAAEMVLAKHSTMVPSSVPPCKGGPVPQAGPRPRDVGLTAKSKVLPE